MTKKSALKTILKTRYLRNLFFLSIAILFVFPLYNLFYAYPSFNALLIRNTVEDAVRAAHHMARMVVLDGKGLEELLDSPEFEHEVGLVGQDFRLEKLKVFSETGKILYSTDSNDLGRVNTKSYFGEVVAKGKVYSKLAKKGTISAEGRKVSSDVVETYVPLIRNGRFAGAFEIYYDVSKRKADVNRLLHRSSLIMYAIGGILLILILMALHNAGKFVVQRDRAQEQLVIFNKGLEETVERRTSDLMETNRRLTTEVEERRQAESALNESERRYRTLFERAGEAIFLLKGEGSEIGKIIDANRTAADMHGYLVSELVGMNIMEIETPRAAEQLPSKMRRILGSEWIYTESAHVRKDGSRFPVEVSAGLLELGNTKFVLAFEKDISKRKEAADLLKLSAEQWGATFDAIEDMIVIVDRNRRILRMNSAMRKTFPDLGTEDHCYRIVHGTPGLPEGCVSCRVFETGVAADYEYYDPRVKKWIELYAYPVKEADGSVRQLVHVLKDVTLQKQEQREREELALRLRRSEKMEAVGTLAGGVAHDLNNILSGITSYPELILMDLPEDSKLRKPILTIRKSGQKAAAIVQDLLTLARRGVVVNEVVNINEIINDYLMSPEFERLKVYHPGVQVETSLRPDLLNILGSPVHLSKTVMNLVSNAAEAITNSGFITISSDHRYVDRPIGTYDRVEEGDYVVVKIADDGMGIPQGHLQRIFEPFYSKKKMGRSGTGLGMAVVWGTVKDHRGYIEVESTEGKGTTFTLYFPVTRKNAGDKTAAGSIEDYLGNGESILVVDDVEEQRELTSGMLMKLGYSPRSATSGEEASAMVKKERPDLVVLDMIMDPGIDGFETYRNIAEIHPGQKAVIVSGFSETESIKKAQELGAGPYVKKPFTLESLGLAIKEELSK